MYGHFTCTYVHAPLMCLTPTGQMSALNLLELELQTVASTHVGVGHHTWGLWESSQCSSEAFPAPSLHLQSS